MESTKTYHILNLGAGVQSTALYLMFLNGELEDKLDYAVFADTQEEPDSVYTHLEWLRSLGGPPILTDTAGKLGDDLIHGKNSTGGRFASIPAFTSATPGQTGGMLRGNAPPSTKSTSASGSSAVRSSAWSPGRGCPRTSRSSSTSVCRTTSLGGSRRSRTASWVIRGRRAGSRSSTWR